MESFAEYLGESIRRGLPHVYSDNPKAPSLSTHDFHHLTSDGKIHVHHATEKTDGATFKIGHDEHGFYTQHSGSGDEKIRHGSGHVERAKRRSKETGRPYNHNVHSAFSSFHDALHKNTKLQKHLASHFKKTKKEVVVRGEAFDKKMSRPSDTKRGEIKFVNTSYHPRHMGSRGSFVIHSKLPENHGHDVEHFKKNLSSRAIKFDHDKVDHEKHHVDISHEKAQFHKLDHDLINSRTKPSNKEAKFAEVHKFNEIKRSVHNKLHAHVKKLGIKNKWGSGTEGLVIHPPKHKPKAPRFKIVSHEFTAAKKANKTRF